MKKLILLNVFCLIVTASCSKRDSDDEIKVKKFETSHQTKADTGQNSGSQKNNLPGEDGFLMKITSKEVRSHIGDSLVIKGFIADVFSGEKVAYLNFENKFPKNVFSCAIFSGKFSEFGDLSSYKGKNVEVTGKITTFKNKPQVILNSKDQIKIIN